MQNGKLQALETVMGNRIFVLDCELGIAEVWWVDKGEVVARWDVCSEFPFSRKESSITKSYSGSQTQMMTFPRVLTCYTGRKEIHEEREGSERQLNWEGWKFPTLAECDQLQAANFSWHLQWSPLLSPLLILHRYTTYFCLWSPGTAHKDIYIKRGEERKEPAWVSFWDTQCYWSHWSHWSKSNIPLRCQTMIYPLAHTAIASMLPYIAFSSVYVFIYLYLRLINKTSKAMG